MAEVVIKQAYEVPREVLRHYERSVIVTGVYALERLLPVVDEHPAKLVVRGQTVHDERAYVQLHAHELCAAVLICHRDLYVRGGRLAVGIPVRQDIEPRIQTRHEAQPYNDHRRHDAVGYAPEVGTENTENILHTFTTSSASSVSLPAGSANPSVSASCAGSAADAASAASSAASASSVSSASTAAASSSGSFSKMNGASTMGSAASSAAASASAASSEASPLSSEASPFASFSFSLCSGS